jgi:hypothetical protein
MAGCFSFVRTTSADFCMQCFSVFLLLVPAIAVVDHCLLPTWPSLVLTLSLTLLALKMPSDTPSYENAAGCDSSM